MIYRFQRFVWLRLACTNRFWPTLTDRLWPDRVSHSLFGQLVWQMGGQGRGEEGGRGGREGGRERGGAEVMALGGPVGGGPGKSDAVPNGCGPQWRGSTRWDPSRWRAVPGGGQHFAFFFFVSRPSFHMFPILCVISKDPESGGGVTRCLREPRCVFFCQ